mmetsp:Transcript_51333/g.81813  ORF Transcript_51333/g.81813 Transcript_51333/m.81813 type:complete len:332 (-) Transcript_51333:250-1245(-)
MLLEFILLHLDSNRFLVTQFSIFLSFRHGLECLVRCIRSIIRSAALSPSDISNAFTSDIIIAFVLLFAVVPIKVIDVGDAIFIARLIVIGAITVIIQTVRFCHAFGVQLFTDVQQTLAVFVVVVHDLLFNLFHVHSIRSHRSAFLAQFLFFPLLLCCFLFLSWRLFVIQLFQILVEVLCLNAVKRIDVFFCCQRFLLVIVCSVLLFFFLHLFINVQRIVVLLSQHIIVFLHVQIIAAGLQIFLFFQRFFLFLSIFVPSKCEDVIFIVDGVQQFVVVFELRVRWVDVIVIVDGSDLMSMQLVSLEIVQIAIVIVLRSQQRIIDLVSNSTRFR